MGVRCPGCFQAGATVVLSTDGLCREREAGSSLWLSPSLYLWKGSRDEWLSLQGTAQTWNLQFLKTGFLVLSDVAKANTLYLPFKSIAGTKSRFEGQGQDRK